MNLNEIKFKRNRVELVSIILLFILTIAVIWGTLEALELIPHELPPTEPFEYPKKE